MIGGGELVHGREALQVWREGCRAVVAVSVVVRVFLDQRLMACRLLDRSGSQALRERRHSPLA